MVCLYFHFLSHCYYVATFHGYLTKYFIYFYIKYDLNFLSVASLNQDIIYSSILIIKVKHGSDTHNKSRTVCDLQLYFKIIYLTIFSSKLLPRPAKVPAFKVNSVLSLSVSFEICPQTSTKQQKWLPKIISEMVIMKNPSEVN